MQRREPLFDKMRLMFFQLPYFTKDADGCENIFERFIYVLNHMDVCEKMPWAAQNSVFQIAEVSPLSKEERYANDESLRQYRDTISVMQGQWLEGHGKGLTGGVEKGMEKGQQQEKADTVHRLQALRLTMEQITQGADQGVDEVKVLFYSSASSKKTLDNVEAYPCLHPYGVG